MFSETDTDKWTIADRMTHHRILATKHNFCHLTQNLFPIFISILLKNNLSSLSTTSKKLKTFVVEFPSSSRLCVGEHSSFLRQSKNIRGVKLIGNSKLTEGVNGCLSPCVNPVIDWWPFQGVLCLSPRDSFNPELDKWKKMDGCLFSPTDITSHQKSFISF